MAIIPTTSGGLGATAPIVGPDDVADESQVIPEAGAQEPLFSFGDQELYDQKVEELGIDGVARDVVGFAKMQLPSFNFTYEELRNGSADILDIVNVASDLPTLTRALSDEAILALFTDVEDYGKYDPPVALKNPDGTPQLDETGQPLYESADYNVAAFAGGGKRAAAPAFFTALGGWQGARIGAATYAARTPKTGITALDVGGKFTAMGVGAVVGSGVLQPVSNVINEWLFEEPDPITITSLKAAENAGETLAYGLSFLSSPWLGTKLAAKPLGEVFDAAKVLQNFKTIASSKFSPETLVKVYGDEIVEKSLKAADLQKGKGRLRRALTPNQAKGPTAARITDTLFRGGKDALDTARKNPVSFLGIEAIAAGGAGLAAFQAEKMAPGSEGILVIKPLLAVTKGTVRAAKDLLNPDLDVAEQTKVFTSKKVSTEGGKRLTAEIRGSEEYANSADPESELENALTILDDYVEMEGRQRLASSILEEAGSPLAPVLRRIEGQLSTRTQELSVATEQGREQFTADAKEAIMKLRGTSTPESLQEAAAIEQRLLEQEIIDKLEVANTKFINAAETVFKNPEVAPQDADLGPRFYDLQMRIVAGLKAKRDQLYKKIGNFDVKSFKTAGDEGVSVRQPNSLTIFDVPVSEGGLKFDSKGAQAEFNTALGRYKDDFKDFDEYFNPPVDADGKLPDGYETPDYPVQFSRLREMLSGLKSTRAARLQLDSTDAVATHITSLLKAIDQDMIGMDATDVFLTPSGELLDGSQAKIVEAYMTAKAYTFAMHNITSRTFVSQSSKVAANRGMVLDPLDALKAVKDGDDIPLSRIHQMQAAADFLRLQTEDVQTISYVNRSTGAKFKDVPFDSEQTSLELL